jgi:hypothetical protein
VSMLGVQPVIHHRSTRTDYRAGFSRLGGYQHPLKLLVDGLCGQIPLGQ